MASSAAAVADPPLDDSIFPEWVERVVCNSGRRGEFRAQYWAFFSCVCGKSFEAELWVGCAVKRDSDAGWDGWDGAAVKLVTAETAGMYSFYDDVPKTRFGAGEYMMAVEWRAMKVGTTDEYMYEQGGRVDLVNSSQLRLAAAGIMKRIAGPPERVRVARRAADIEKERSDRVKRVWRLPAQNKALALAHCNPPTAN